MRFCPFCGTVQAIPAAPAAPETAAGSAADAGPEASAAPLRPELPALHFRLEPGQPEPRPALHPPPRALHPPPRAPAVAPPVHTPPPGPAAAAEPVAPVAPPAARTRRIGRNRAALGLLVLAALGAGVLAERAGTGRPASRQLSLAAGPGWTAVPIERFRGQPYLRLSAESPFAIRLDGERVMRVTRTLRLTLAPLRRLELRAQGGTVAVAVSGEGP